MAGETAGWLVYMIRCCDGSYYTGITTDIERRVRQHAEGRGAKYFRGRQPRELVYLEGGHDRSSASKREVAIKRLTRREKERLLAESGAVPNPSPLCPSP
jgi:putative endonuclease